MESAQTEINSKYHFVSLDQASIPKDGFLHCYKNRYWSVHPTKGLAFWGKGYASPQCNSNESLAKRLAPPWAEVKFIETVLVPLDITAYME